MDVFKAGISFDNFHYWAKYPLSDMALLPRCLMLWLKRCVVFSTSNEALNVIVVYPAIHLAYRLGLLFAMTYGI